MRNYRAALDETRTMLANLYEKYAEDGKLTLAEMTKYNRLSGMEKQITEIMGPVYSKVTKKLNRLGSEQYEQSYYRHQWALDQTTGVGLEWGMINEKAMEAASSNLLDKIAIDGMKRNGLDSIRRKITQGLIQGQSYDKMAREVKGAFDDVARNTVRIVRTEGQRAMVEGQQATYDEAEELVEHLVLKFNEEGALIPPSQPAAGPLITRVTTIGGVTKEGADATNEMTYIFMDAKNEMGFNQPALAVRLHPQTPQALNKKIVDSLAKQPGVYSFFNDNMMVPFLLNLGIPLGDAREYATDGCMRWIIPGKAMLTLAGDGCSIVRQAR